MAGTTKTMDEICSVRQTTEVAVASDEVLQQVLFCYLILPHCCSVAYSLFF